MKPRGKLICLCIHVYRHGVLKCSRQSFFDDLEKYRIYIFTWKSKLSIVEMNIKAWNNRVLHGQNLSFFSSSFWRDLVRVYCNVLCNMLSSYRTQILMQHLYNICLYYFSDQLLKCTILPAVHVPQLSVLASFPVSARENSHRNMITKAINRRRNIWFNLILYSQLFTTIFINKRKFY